MDIYFLKEKEYLFKILDSKEFEDIILSHGKHRDAKISEVSKEYVLSIYRSDIDNLNTQTKEWILKLKRQIKDLIQNEKTKLTCAKKYYLSKKEANIHINWIKDHQKGDKIPKRSYFCEKCGFWHVTSKEKEEYESEKRRRSGI